MRKTLLAMSLMAATAAVPAHAEYLYGFGSLSVNHLDWSKGTEERAGGFKEDFLYVEIEGGAGFDWGELYGFFDVENVQDGSSETRVASKGSITYKTGLDELRLYAHSYSTENGGWHIRNTVTGLSYSFAGEGWFFNPFIGFHHTNTAGYVGMNGGMAGWVGGYNFDAFGQSFSISNWNEIEFSRKDEYLALSEKDSTGLNGALALWWNVTEDVTTGVQYRYSNNKLGQENYANALIYTVKYNF
ncbi:outer membrane protein OmpK [Thaumasiovibrio subtropicus]|uniref:outer membrane protein OmpK n=1 Tax=Thaumasiovibrio subtropicus TaxID=1891207 RepID=UPI000B34EAAB|nr:outer membrane protein OmpK [Thaumasiovibrio subtropicus]